MWDLNQITQLIIRCYPKRIKNVLIVGPQQLVDEDTKALAAKWQNSKKQWKELKLAINAIEFENLANGDYDDPLQLVPFDELITATSFKIR